MSFTLMKIALWNVASLLMSQVVHRSAVIQYAGSLQFDRYAGSHMYIFYVMAGTLRLGDVEVCVAICAATTAVDTDIRYKRLFTLLPCFISENEG